MKSEIETMLDLAFEMGKNDMMYKDWEIYKQKMLEKYYE